MLLRDEPDTNLCLSRKVAGSTDIEVEHFIATTFHTNIYYAMRNDWPSLNMAHSRYNPHAEEDEGPLCNAQYYSGSEAKKQINSASERKPKLESEQSVAPLPFEGSSKVVLNSCTFDQFPKGNIMQTCAINKHIPRTQNALFPL